MSGVNLEKKIEELEYKYGGVLQKLAELHDAVVSQLEDVKTAGVKIRREKTNYISGTVLACVGRNNGNKYLFALNTGTTAEGQKDESFYDGLAINATWNDGGVTWKVVEDAFTSGSIVWSAMNASHAEIADHASSAGSAGYASSAGYIGPFHVHQGARVESQTIVSSGVTSTFDGFNVTVQDDTRPVGTGGYIVNGNQNLPVQSFANFLADGKTLYLFGSSGNPPYFECGFYFGDPKTPGAGEFVTALAKNEGGKIIQMQFGDIVTPWPGGEGGEDYNGPFKVFVTGSSSVISNSGTTSQTSSMKYDFELYDPTSPINSNTNKHEWGGKVFAGENYYQAGITSGSVKAGDFIYLVGDSRAGEVSFKYTNYVPEVTSTGGSNSSTGQQTITSAGFYTRIAQVHGASVTQIQHGDITVPPWKVTSADSATSATHATSADYAAEAGYAEYKGPFHVSATAVNSNTSAATVTVYDDTRASSIGGYVVVGSNVYPAGTSGGMTLSNGYKMFLIGSSTSNGGVDFLYSAASSDPSPGAGETWMFYAQLAYNAGGKVFQTHYGDIVQPQEGVKKISLIGGTITPPSGTGDVTINIPSPGGGNILPVNWSVMAGTNLYPTHIIGQGKYTTDPDYDDTDPDAEYIKLGEGYGGIIVGWIVAPLDAGLWSQDEYEYNLNIEQTSYASISIPLLVPESTKVVIPSYSLEYDEDTGEYSLESHAEGANGECYTPRKSYVYLPIPPNTYFNLTETGTGFHGSSSLMFYPYVQPS